MTLMRMQAQKLSQELDLVQFGKTLPANAAELHDLSSKPTKPQVENSQSVLLEPPVAEVGNVGGCFHVLFLKSAEFLLALIV